MEDDEIELPKELKEFIDQLIVPLLVAQLTRHSNSAASSEDYPDEGLAPAA